MSLRSFHICSCFLRLSIVLFVLHNSSYPLAFINFLTFISCFSGSLLLLGLFLVFFFRLFFFVSFCHGSLWDWRAGCGWVGIDGARWGTEGWRRKELVADVRSSGGGVGGRVVIDTILSSYLSGSDIKPSFHRGIDMYLAAPFQVILHYLCFFCIHPSACITAPHSHPFIPSSLHTFNYI